MSMSGAVEELLKCNACHSKRPLSSFPLRADGSRRKTCSKHQKRAAVTNTWEDVAARLRIHSAAHDGGPSQSLHGDWCIDFDTCPVPISPSRSIKDVAASAHLLARAIWNASGFRFVAVNQFEGKDGLSFYYHCAQDSRIQASSTSTGKRTPADNMSAHECDSRLVLVLKSVSKIVNIRLDHIPHQPYCDRSMPPEVIEFIEARLDSTPGQIYQDLICSTEMREMAQAVTQKQVWYWWRAGTSSSWQLSPDPFESMTKALEGTMLGRDDGPEQGALAIASFCTTSPALSSASGARSPSTFVLGQEIWKEGRCCGFANYAVGLIAALRERTVEISLDATYGTNNSGHDLFGVLAELDGTGVPLMYLFMDTKDMLGDGRKIEILTASLAILNGMGIDPTFVGCDKDTAEIAAIKAVWPRAKVQLCYWHVRRALRSKLASGKKTGTNTYQPFDAAATVPDLEVCWGVPSKRRHDLQWCTCACRPDTQWDEPGRLEVPKEQSEDLINFLSRHFNIHPLFPTVSGVVLTAEQLRIRAATEAYQYCKQRGWARVWAYLWTNWYRKGEWELWARSANESIPVLKTTMICESHWRTIKHDYLHRFARPRLDHVSFVLRTRVVPTMCLRVAALLSKNTRLAMPSWRKEFVKAWDKEQVKDVSEESISHYRTCPHLWLCACEAFMGSRFLICKHLVSLVEPMSKNQLKQIQRHRQPPIWTHSSLVCRLSETACAYGHTPLPETSPAAAETEDGEVGEGGEAGEPRAEDEEEDHDGDGEVQREWEDRAEDGHDEGEGSAESVQDSFEEMLGILTDMQSLITRERRWASRPFIEAIIRTNKQNIKLLLEDKERLRRQSMALTWSSHQHPATMYLKGSSDV
ncbi:hypothetical protein A4X13_0g2356 [Tilletia indica]|uniref:Uncharacterized protein n=1 Tax=Tilletia indica TaxID=43049 RepID=A0A177TAC7_9BASI|nr:hypothetical protein A4X13_0g2356 [Tilletia indica]